jgi:hypothetical protein
MTPCERRHADTFPLVVAVTYVRPHAAFERNDATIPGRELLLRSSTSGSAMALPSPLWRDDDFGLDVLVENTSRIEADQRPG